MEETLHTWALALEFLSYMLLNFPVLLVSTFSSLSMFHVFTTQLLKNYFLTSIHTLFMSNFQSCPLFLTLLTLKYCYKRTYSWPPCNLCGYHVYPNPSFLQSGKIKGSPPLFIAHSTQFWYHPCEFLWIHFSSSF